MKKNRRLRRKIAAGFAVLLAVLIAFAAISPIPVSYLIRFMFRNGMAVPPDNYAEMQNRVTVFGDLTYPSAYKDNRADVYLPKSGGVRATILWIHGGAFVGGDKQDIAVYATALASEGYAVVCMNYRRAPEAKYPSPVIQTRDAYLWMESESGEYGFDMSRLVLAGDSAGAHIAAQFAAVQCNPDYAGDMGMPQTVPPENIRAMLLFCGPYDAAEIGVGGNFVLNLMLGKAAKAYFGGGDWVLRVGNQATIAPHITASFPPAFVSDGNTGSFEDHARNLAEAMSAAGVPVEAYFIDPAVEETPHEYQFVMNTPAGIESFRRTLGFLREYTS